MKKLQNERSAILISLVSLNTRIKEEYESRSGQAFEGGLGADSIPQG